MNFLGWICHKSLQLRAACGRGLMMFDDVTDVTCGRESVNGESFAESLLPWRSQAESESLISDRNHALIGQ